MNLKAYIFWIIVRGPQPVNRRLMRKSTATDAHASHGMLVRPVARGAHVVRARATASLLIADRLATSEHTVQGCPSAVALVPVGAGAIHAHRR